MRMKKLLTFLTLLTLFFTTGWAETITVTIQGFGGDNNSGYTTSAVSASFGGVNFSANNFIGSTGQVRGNKTNVGNNFYISNTSALPGNITKIELITAGTGSFQNQMYALTGTSSQSNTTSLNNAIEGTLSSDNKSFTWTFDSSDGKTFFKLLSNKVFTSGNATNTTVKITYDDGTTPEPTYFSLTLPNVENGSFSVVDGSNNTISNLSQILSGTNITVTAIPNTGYTLEWMKANGVDVTNPYEFVINAATTITASFIQEQASTTEWVLTTPSALTTGDVVLIVDKYSARAMSNNNGTSAAPSATSVTLNSNKDKVTAGVTAALQWEVTKTDNAFNFTVPNGTTHLYCTNTNNGVRVGTNNNKDFTINNDYLYNTATSRYLGVYNNQEWRCYDNTTGNIANTEIAFYKKVETGSHTVNVGTITGEGTITPSSGSANAGDVITVTATPAPGYELTALAYNGTAIDITSTPYTFIMPNADVTLTATFSLKDYVVAYQVTPSTAAANSGNRVGLISGAPYDTQTQASHSQMGTSVTFKLYTGNGWQIDDANVSVAYTDANGNPATLTPTKGDTNSDDGGYGTYFTFTMPGSDVMINAAYLPYQPDLYILGNVNGGTHWNDGGLKMTFDPSANTYSIRIYASEENGYFRFYANGGNNGNPSYGAGGVNLNPLEGTQPKDLWKDGDANFCVPAGIYDIVVGQIFDDPTTNSNPNWWGQTTVTVTAVEPTFTFNPAAGSTVYQGTNVTVTSNLYDLLHAINSDITESSVTNEVSLDGTTFSGSVALDNTGSATVTGKATYGYIAPTATASYTVNEIPAGSEYTLVTDASELNNGDEIVFMSKGSGSGYAMSTTQASNNRPQTEEALSIIDSKIVPSAETQIITLEGATGAWYFNVGNGYLYAASSSNNYLRTEEEEADDNAKAAITIDNDGAATIEFQGSNTRNQLRHNANNKIYSCYASGQQPVYIFRKASATPMEQVATPTFSLAEGTYTEAQSVTISCATDGATILYSTDGTNYSTYTGAINVSQTTTLYAKATKAGMTPSAVAQATYTIETTPVEPGEGDFTLVTGEEQLIAGREYIIVVQDLTSGSSTNPDHYGVYALSAVNAGTTTAQQHARKAVNGDENIMLAEGYQTATVPTGSEVEIFQLEGTTGAWKLHGTNGYLYGTQGSNYLDISSSIDNGWEVASIAIQSGSVAKIQFNNDSRWLQCNPNNNSGVINPYFSCYSSNQKQVYLYYRDSKLVMPPVFTPNPGVYGIDVDVTISCPTSGATIYYTTDGSDPKTSSTRQEYTGEIVVSQTTTFKAVAVKGEETSSVTEATYTISKSTDIETVTLDYREPFTEGVGNFYVVNESGFSPVWTLDGNYGIKGTSFSGGVNYAATSRFISPIIDMTDATQPELTFSHQINSYFTDVANQCQLFIRETTDGTDGTWVQLPITFSDPAANGGWTNDVANIDLSEWAGKKVQISFLYTNPTAGSGAGTWEIQNFVVADNSEYRMVNNIAEFLALPENTKAKFRNPVTVLYDYAQYSSNSYHEYIWVKDESGYMQFYLVPTLNSGTSLDDKAAYYENGDIIPAGFVVVKNYYENGKYVQAYSANALEAGFQAATQKGLADPDYIDFDVLSGLDNTNTDHVATWCNRYITLEKIKITSKYGNENKSFRFANESGTVNNCVGYNKYNGDGSLLKDGTTSADVTVPAVSDTYYNVKAILQLWQGGWEIMPIEFTEWKAEEVTLRKLCADGEVNGEYIISNNLLGVYASADGTKLWVKDDNGQSVCPVTPVAPYTDNFAIEFEDLLDGNNNVVIPANTRLEQQYYDQSNWCEIQLTGNNAADFVGKIIKGGLIEGKFTNKTNPTLENVELQPDFIYRDGSYSPNYYIPASFVGSQSCNTDMYGQDGHGDFFFMTPKPQEYATIVWAIWDGQKMNMPTMQDGNSHDLFGEFSIDLSMNQNHVTAIPVGAYSFHAIIRKVNTAGAPALKGKGDIQNNQSASYMVYPLDIDPENNPSTAINTVDVTGKAVKSVKFYNVAGIESATPFQGINIVVTEYTDGTRTTTKMLCR